MPLLGSDLSHLSQTFESSDPKIYIDPQWRIQYFLDGEGVNYKGGCHQPIVIATLSQELHDTEKIQPKMGRATLASPSLGSANGFREFIIKFKDSLTS